MEYFQHIDLYWNVQQLVSRLYSAIVAYSFKTSPPERSYSCKSPKCWHLPSEKSQTRHCCTIFWLLLILHGGPKRNVTAHVTFHDIHLVRRGDTSTPCCQILLHNILEINALEGLITRFMATWYNRQWRVKLSSFGNAIGLHGGFNTQYVNFDFVTKARIY